MNAQSWIILGILLIIVGGALWYIHKESKKGIKCVGCPYAKGCGGEHCSSGKYADTNELSQAMLNAQDGKVKTPASAEEKTKE